MKNMKKLSLLLIGLSLTTGCGTSIPFSGLDTSANSENSGQARASQSVSNADNETARFETGGSHEGTSDMSILSRREGSENQVDTQIQNIKELTPMGSFKPVSVKPRTSSEKGEKKNYQGEGLIKVSVSEHSLKPVSPEKGEEKVSCLSNLPSEIRPIGDGHNFVSEGVNAVQDELFNVNEFLAQEILTPIEIRCDGYSVE